MGNSISYEVQVSPAIPATLTFATIGNVEARVVNSSRPIRLLARRGIVGTGISQPLMSQHVWDPRAILIPFSDGIGSRWDWGQSLVVSTASATEIAQTLLWSLAKDNDDATAVVVRSRGEQRQET
jgi:hypothetical protein